jgi:hypothetical protein
LFQQLSSVLNNGKEFQQQISSHRAVKKDEKVIEKEEFSSPVEPKKQTHKSNTPSFHQNQFSIGSIAGIRPMPSPLQLSFNISDILSDQKHREVPDAPSNQKPAKLLSDALSSVKEDLSMALEQKELTDSPVQTKHGKERTEMCDSPEFESRKSIAVHTNESNLNEAEPEEEQICN